MSDETEKQRARIEQVRKDLMDFVDHVRNTEPKTNPEWAAAQATVEMYVVDVDLGEEPSHE